MHVMLMFICAITGSFALSSWQALAKNPPPVSTLTQANATQTGNGVLDTSAAGYVRIDHDPEFDLTADFTVEVRASFEHFVGHQEIIKKASAWNQDGFVFKWYDRRLQFIHGETSASGQGAHTVADVEISDLEPNRMYELAVVKTDSAVTFFVDGQIVGEGRIGSLVATSADLTVSTPWTEGSLAGQVDELRIWSHARTANELAASSVQRYEGHERQLLALFTFDGVEGGQTVTNISKPAHHGEVVGNATLIHTHVLPAMRPKN